MTLVYITCKDKREAERISMRLLRKRLIACANTFPVKSMYRWNKKVIKDNENVVIAKAKDKNFKRIVAEVKKMHSYQIPCILKIDAEANKDYERWVNKEIR